VFLAAAKNYGAKLSYVTEDDLNSHNFIGSTEYEDALYVKGRRAIINPYWWYKSTETAKTLSYLSDKVLTDFYTSSEDNDIFCKYTDIYLKRDNVITTSGGVAEKQENYF
jgi:hypothetical protein